MSEEHLANASHQESETRQRACGGLEPQSISLNRLFGGGRFEGKHRLPHACIWKVAEQWSRLVVCPVGGVKERAADAASEAEDGRREL